MGNHVVLLKATFKMSGIYCGLIGYAQLIADTDRNLILEQRTQRTSRGQAPPNDQNRRRWGYVVDRGASARAHPIFSIRVFATFFRGVGALRKHRRGLDIAQAHHNAVHSWVPRHGCGLAAQAHLPPRGSGRLRSGSSSGGSHGGSRGSGAAGDSPGLGEPGIH